MQNHLKENVWQEIGSRALRRRVRCGVAGPTGGESMKTIYLDNAATSFPKAPGVGEAMARYISDIGANINRGTYRQATDAAMTVLETRAQLKELFHFDSDEAHVVFTPGATAGLNTLLKGLLKPGDHVIVSGMEHNAVMRPLTELADGGVRYSRICADTDGLTDASAILPMIRPETKLVLVSHASNVSGTLFPLEEVAQICHAHSLPLAVDAAQTAGHIPVNFEALHLAALCVPGHKGLLGPQGIGALLLDGAFAPRVSPLFTGGTGSASDSERQPACMPDRFESGTQNIPGIFGLHAALSYVLQRGVPSLRAHETHLTGRFLKGLEGLPLRVAGTQNPARRTGVVSVDFLTMDNAAAAFRLENEYGVLTRCGLHCAPNAHKTLGTFPQGTVRFSIGYSTTEEDISDALEAVHEICGCPDRWAT